MQSFVIISSTSVCIAALVIWAVHFTLKVMKRDLEDYQEGNH